MNKSRKTKLDKSKGKLLAPSDASPMDDSK